jgi:hypothetical protein
MRRFLEPMVAAAVGCLAAVLLHAAYGWWLNSGSNVVRTLVVLAVLGWLAALWRPAVPWRQAGTLWAGALAGMAAILFWIGPGTIWPIVLATAALLSAAAVFSGTWIGLAVGRRRR